MRIPALLLVVMLALAAVLAGCIEIGDGPAVDAAGVDQSETSVTDAATPTGPVELGTMGFTLGPVGSAITPTAASLDIQVPEGIQNVVLQLSLANGVTVDFMASGLPGCEQVVELPSYVAGYERATDCLVEAGSYEVVVYHTTGYVQGTLTVVAIYPSADSHPVELSES